MDRQVERFYGSFEHTLDAKGRVILPSRLRSHFDSRQALVSCYVDRCLAVWTPDEFGVYLSRAQAMEERGSEGRNLARALSAMSAPVEVDGQWRLTIPPNLREWAGLQVDSPLMVIGALNRIELWQPDLWRQRMAPSLDSLADGTSLLFSDQPAAAGAPVPGAGQ